MMPESSKPGPSPTSAAKSQTAQNPWRKIKKGLQWSGALVVGMTTLLIAAAGGYYLGIEVNSWIQQLDQRSVSELGADSFWRKAQLAIIAGVPVVSAASVLAILVRTVNAATTFREFLTQGRLTRLLAPALALFSATFLFGLAGLPSTQKSPPEMAVGLFDRVGLIFPGQEGSQADILVTFRDEASADYTSGVQLDDFQKLFLEDLIGDLKDCGSSAYPLELEIRGFASTSGPGTREDLAYREINLEAAQRRARAVAEALEGPISEELGSGSIELSVHSWFEPGAPRKARYSQANYDQMFSRLRFSDRLEGVYSPGRGRLNKRVEIRIVAAGVCQPRPAMSLRGEHRRASSGFSEGRPPLPSRSQGAGTRGGQGASLGR